MARGPPPATRGAGAVNKRPWRILTGMFLGFIVAALCLIFALRHVEFWRLRVELKNAEFQWVPPLLVAVFVFYRLKAARWSLLLSPCARVSGIRLFPSVIIGYAANTLMPLQLGDWLRAGIAARAEKLPTAPVLISIGFERVIDLITLLVPVAIAFTTMPHVPPVMSKTILLFSAITVFALAVFIFYLFWTQRFLAITRAVCRLLPARLANGIQRQVELGVEGLAALRSPVLLIKVFATSVIHWMVWIFAVWCSLQALEIDAPPIASLLVGVLLVIGTNVPNSPGYVGSIQLAFVLGLRPFGVSAEEALAASLLLHIVAYPSIVIAGIAYLRKQRIGLTELREALPGFSPRGGD